MSYVTNIILTATMLEFEGDSDACPAVDHVNEWLRARGLGELKRADNIGNPRALEAAIFFGAFNYLDLGEFVEVIASAPWVDDEGVVVFVKRQDDGHFIDLASLE